MFEGRRHQTSFLQPDNILWWNDEKTVACDNLFHRSMHFQVLCDVLVFSCCSFSFNFLYCSGVIPSGTYPTAKGIIIKGQQHHGLSRKANESLTEKKRLSNENTTVHGIPSPYWRITKILTLQRQRRCLSVDRRHKRCSIGQQHGNANKPDFHHRFHHQWWINQSNSRNFRKTQSWGISFCTSVEYARVPPQNTTELRWDCFVWHPRIINPYNVSYGRARK